MFSNNVFWPQNFQSSLADNSNYRYVIYDTSYRNVWKNNTGCIVGTRPATVVFPPFNPLDDIQNKSNQGCNHDDTILSHHCCRGKKSRRSVNSTIAPKFKGQTFPFRLWMLVNDPDYDDVCLWAPNGSSLIIPDLVAFTTKVLQKSVDRIFATTEMKSFVRQLNLYGFHKVQVEKDELYFYLKNKDKKLWPDAVFANPNFKQGHPELLENIKRRCRVKEQKKILKSDGLYQQFYNNTNMSSHAFPPNVALNQFLPHNVENMLPQLEQQHPRLERKATKRKLDFEPSEERKPIPQLSPPIFISPQQTGSSNMQMIPPSWSMQPQMMCEDAFACSSGGQGDERPYIGSQGTADDAPSQWNPQANGQPSEFFPMAAFWAALLHSGNKTNGGPF